MSTPRARKEGRSYHPRRGCGPAAASVFGGAGLRTTRQDAAVMACSFLEPRCLNYRNGCAATVHRLGVQRTNSLVTGCARTNHACARNEIAAHIAALNYGRKGAVPLISDRDFSRPIHRSAASASALITANSLTSSLK